MPGLPNNLPMDRGDDHIVVGIGELLWDVFPDRKVMGGAPANFAYHISQFGFDGRAVSAVGDDPDGMAIKELLAGKKLGADIATVDYPTGRVLVRLDKEGIPQYEIARDVAWDNIPFTEELTALAARTGTVCFGSLAQRSSVSRRTIRRFIEALPPGSLKIFDINLRQDFYSRVVIEESMHLAGILKINDEEVSTVADLFSIDGPQLSVCRKLADRFDLDIVILTRGTDGSYVLTADGGESFLPTPKVEVADTVGAGDSFTAGFTAALLKGRSIREAHALGVEVSAFVCSCEGAMPALPAGIISEPAF